MAIPINVVTPINYPDGEGKTVLKYLDLLIVKFPDFDDFDLVDEIIILEKEIQDSKASGLTSKIETVLLELRYTKRRGSNYNTPQLRLTDLGREVKKKGGHFKYEKYLENLKNKQGKIDKLTKENLKLQNKLLRRKIKYGVIGGIIGYLLGFATSNFQWILSLF